MPVKLTACTNRKIPSILNDMYTGFRETYPPIQAMAFVLFILKEKAMQI